MYFGLGSLSQEEYLSSEVFFTECFDEDVLKFILDRLYFLSVEQNLNTL